MINRRVTANAPAQPTALPPEWRLGILLILAAGLLMSGFIDTLVIQVLGHPEVDRRFRILIALFLTALLFLIGVVAYSQPVPRAYNERLRPPWEWPLKAILMLIPVWAIIGVINQWPPTYILGDVFMLAIMPATYFVLVRRPMENPALVFRWIYGVMLWFAVLSSLLVFYHNLFLGGRHKMSLDAAIPPVFYILLKAAPAPWELALLPFFALAALMTSKRSTWAALLLAGVMALLLRPGLRRPMRIGIMLIGVVGVVYIATRYRPDLVEHSFDLLERRWTETMHDLSGEYGSDLDLDSGGRMGEAAGVVDTINDRGVPVDWALGLGLGSMIQARAGRLRHHVHSTPMAFLARTGLVGLALWLIFVLSVLRVLVINARQAPDEWHRVQFFFWSGLWFSMMVFSLKSQAFWGSVMGGIQLAYLSHLCHSAARVRVTVAVPAEPNRLALRRLIFQRDA